MTSRTYLFGNLRAQRKKMVDVGKARDDCLQTLEQVFVVKQLVDRIQTRFDYLDVCKRTRKYRRL